MRSRDEVLSEYMERPDCLSALADRIRELEAQQAASEPVAWALMRGDVPVDGFPPTFALPTDAFELQRVFLAEFVPLYAHPSAAAVRDAALEAAAAAFYHEQYGAQGGRYELVNPRHRHVWRDKARAVLTAALTAASEGASA